jgi:hypothetical protein
VKGWDIEIVFRQVVDLEALQYLVGPLEDLPRGRRARKSEHMVRIVP